MNISVRSYLTAGVAAVGASAIALTPVMVTPTLPEVQIPAVHAVTADVALAANPIDRWFEVFEATAANVEDLVALVAAAPAPIAEQIIKNAIANGKYVLAGWKDASQWVVDGVTAIPTALKTAAALLVDGEVEAAVSAALEPLLTIGLSALLFLDPVIGVLSPGWSTPEDVRGVFNNLAAVANTIISGDTLLAVAMVAGGLLLSPVNALAHTAQQVVDGIKDGKLGEAVNAVLNIPADLVDAVLNGAGVINFLGAKIPAPGLLSVDKGLSGGLFATVQVLRENIAKALGWTPADEEEKTAVETQDSFVPEEVEVTAVPEVNARLVPVSVVDTAVLEGTEDAPRNLNLSKDELAGDGPAVGADDASAPSGGEAKTDRAARLEAAKAERDAAKAERKAERDAAKSERAAKRDAVRSERAGKRAEAAGSADAA